MSERDYLISKAFRVPKLLGRAAKPPPGYDAEKIRASMGAARAATQRQNDARFVATANAGRAAKQKAAETAAANRHTGRFQTAQLRQRAHMESMRPQATGNNWNHVPATLAGRSGAGGSLVRLNANPHARGSAIYGR